MIIDDVQPGTAVIAGDVVKIQHGKKYPFLTYFDFDAALNIFTHDNQLTEDKAFEYDGSVNETFCYWQLNNPKIQNPSVSAHQIAEFGIDTNTSAYANANVQTTITYLPYTADLPINQTDTQIINKWLVAADDEKSQIKYGVTYACYPQNIILQNYEYSDKASLALTSDFKGWKILDVEYDISSNPIYSLTTDVSAYPIWKQKFNVTLITPDTSRGELCFKDIQDNGMPSYSYVSKREYYDGDIVHVAAFPNANYLFSSWTDGKQIYTENEFEFKITENTILTAIFQPVEINVSLGVSDLMRATAALKLNDIEVLTTNRLESYVQTKLHYLDEVNLIKKSLDSGYSIVYWLVQQANYSKLYMTDDNVILSADTVIDVAIAKNTEYRLTLIAVPAYARCKGSGSYEKNNEVTISFSYQSFYNSNNCEFLGWFEYGKSLLISKDQSFKHIMRKSIILEARFKSTMYLVTDNLQYGFTSQPICTSDGEEIIYIGYRN